MRAAADRQRAGNSNCLGFESGFAVVLEFRGQADDDGPGGEGRRERHGKRRRERQRERKSGGDGNHRAAAEGIVRKLGAAGLGIALVHVPADPALGADEPGTESVAGCTRSIHGIGDRGCPFGRASARCLPSDAAPVVTHSTDLQSPFGKRAAQYSGSGSAPDARLDLSGLSCEETCRRNSRDRTRGPIRDRRRRRR